MELRIKPYDKNIYPLRGILIKDAQVAQWLSEIQLMGLSLSALTVYPVPGTVANTVWGCLLTGDVMNVKDIRRNTWCQAIGDVLFIPERSVLYPRLLQPEVEKLAGGKPHLLHPECGLVALEEAVDWKQVIELPAAVAHTVTSPAETVYIPKQVKTFQVKPVKVEDVLEQFEEKHFPKRQSFKEKPLNPFEKVKLFFYRQLFTNKGTSTTSDKPLIERTPLSGMLQSIRNLFSRGSNKWMDKLQMSYEELEKRNQKHLDRLLDLLKKNPQEALKYALPLDPDGTGRGGRAAMFDLEKRWFDFSLFGNWGGGSSGGGVAVFSSNAFNQLHEQYMNTAKELIRQGEHRKAAFVYMKLLKNYWLAAQTLEAGGHYQEAASVYLKFCSNKQKAAECFEKGNMTFNAIELYKDLGQHEKVGDLYLSIDKKEEAFEHYRKLVMDYVNTGRYVKASLVYKDKMNNEADCQELLLIGWRLEQDAFNCLNNYFSNISDAKQLSHELHKIYQSEVNDKNCETFLRVLKYEYEKHEDLSAAIRDMAHEIIARRAVDNPSVVSEMHSFNKNDRQLIKDTLRFKVSKR